MSINTGDGSWTFSMHNENKIIYKNTNAFTPYSSYEERRAWMRQGDGG